MKLSLSDLRIISSTSWAYSSSKIATLPVVSTLLYDPGFLILTHQGRPFLPCWIFMDVTADYSFSDFRSPFSVLRSPFPVPRSTFPAPRSRFTFNMLSCLGSCSCSFFFFFFWLSHSGFSRNTSNGNPGSIKSFPTNKVYFEEKKKRLRNGIGIWSRFQGIFRGLFIINVFFTSLVIFGDL